MSKKKFKDTTVGKLLFGAASVVSPQLGAVLNGVTSPKDAIAEITKAKIPTEDKIKLQTLIYEQQNKEMEEISTRWKADAASDSWLSKNVRPLVLVGALWYLVLQVYWILLIQIPFNIGTTWNDTFEKVMMAVVLAYFGGRTTEKASSIIKGK